MAQIGNFGEYMKKNILFSISCAALITVSGCGSTSEVWKKGNPASFESSKPARSLAVCIERNSNYSWGGSQKATMRELEPGLFEVVRASADMISVVVQVSPVPSGSHAEFRFAGFDVGLASHVADMTKDCK